MAFRDYIFLFCLVFLVSLAPVVLGENNGAVNPYDDLIVGFTGNGSVDRNVTVPPGETIFVYFMVHAQDAVLEDYDIPITLKNLDADNISDNAIVHVSVHIPNINFTL
jgi:hypothetical protein